MEHPEMRKLFQLCYDEMNQNLSFYTLLAGAVSFFVGVITSKNK